MPRLLLSGLLVLTLFAGLPSPSLAGLEEAEAALNRGDYETALKEYTPFAEQGDAHAQAIVGIIYQGVAGGPQDYVQAAKWLRLAADQGEPEADAKPFKILFVLESQILFRDPRDTRSVVLQMCGFCCRKNEIACVAGLSVSLLPK